jgi:acyl-CoA thioesterase-1
VASQQHITLVPFLFQGFAEDSDLFQGDRIHPSAAAQPMLLDNVWGPLQPLLR